jgi:hypothetical protein
MYFFVPFFRYSLLLSKNLYEIKFIVVSKFLSQMQSFLAPSEKW